VSTSQALRELYEALEMLDARQTGAARPEVIDLREPSGPTSLSTSVRYDVGADWVLEQPRW
jgi:hypothetical protein